ncbi:MAG TPA: penicillin-binding protein 1C [Candidatus Cybelea sp.]|nr:penicillin-binding protein 1C [Candidatus Cybelea sp.]
MRKHFALALAILALAAGIGVERSGIDVAKLRTPQGSVTYTDRNGIVLGTILGAASAHSVNVPLGSVSPVFVEAILAAEDARFWRHGAVDVRALLRAARDYAIFGEARSGGSTIEMQLARLLYPSTQFIPSGVEGLRMTGSEEIRGKLRQIALAERIEIASNKTAELTAYVNRVPMGGNLYGVEAAARAYFGEPAADLDLAQASLLAAIPNDPARLAPDTGWQALRVRQRYVLRRMVDLGEITPTAANRAFAETLKVHLQDSGIEDAPHALFFLYATGGIRSGRVSTTLDRPLQRFVQAQTQDVIGALERYHVTGAAALVVDNRSGEVLAYVGSPDYFSDEALGRNDGVRALRQPGSSLKPFTYELALERGTIRSTTILQDEPAAYAIAGGKLYAPGDYSGRFSGPVRVRYALANSLNVPAVRVLSNLGVEPFLARLRALGFAHLDHPPSYYGLGLTLGSGEVSLWENVQAYVALARGGSFLPLHLTPGNPTPRSIGDSADWALVTDMLADAHARVHSFGLHSVLEMPFPAAVKTGTSSDFHDTWTIGFTRDYTVGVWVGNFDGSPMHGVSGVTGAAPLWNRIMLHLYDRNAEPPAFPAPSGFVRKPICATTGRVVLQAGDDCAAVVQEWIAPRDLPELRARDEAAALRIVFPRDGDTFVLNATTSALQREEQQLLLRAIDAGGSVRWHVNGAALVYDAGGNAFWPLRLGTWRIEAADGRRRDRVTIRVVPPQIARPGFTFAKARD